MADENEELEQEKIEEASQEELQEEPAKKPKKKKKSKGGCLAKIFTFFLLVLIACAGAIYYAYQQKIITEERIYKTIKATPIGEYLPQQNKTLQDYKSPQLAPITPKDIPFRVSMLDEEKINKELKELMPLRVRIKKKEIPKEKLVQQSSYLFLQEAKYETIRKTIWAIREAGGRITSCVVAGKTLVFVGPFHGVVQLQEFYSKFDPKYQEAIDKRITRDTYATLCIDDGRQLISLEVDENKTKEWGR